MPGRRVAAECGGERLCQDLPVPRTLFSSLYTHRGRSEAGAANVPGTPAAQGWSARDGRGTGCLSTASPAGPWPCQDTRADPPPPHPFPPFAQKRKPLPDRQRCGPPR